MTRLGIPPALVLLVLLLGGCSSPNAALTAERQRAEQGDADAQVRLGIAYHLGQGAPQDFTQAAAWYRKAADQGDAVAQGFLGDMHRKGEGVPKDLGQAVAWYRKAADQGDAAAQSSLALSYQFGEGVIQDDVEALKWWTLASSGVSDDTQEFDAAREEAFRQFYAATRDQMAEAMTPAQIAEGQKRAADWQAAFEKRQPNYGLVAPRQRIP